MSPNVFPVEDIKDLPGMDEESAQVTVDLLNKLSDDLHKSVVNYVDLVGRTEIPISMIMCGAVSVVMTFAVRVSLNGEFPKRTVAAMVNRILETTNE